MSRSFKAVTQRRMKNGSNLLPFTMVSKYRAWKFMMVKRFRHKKPYCLLPSWASAGDFSVGMNQVSDLTSVSFWGQNLSKVYDTQCIFVFGQHLPSDHINLKLQIYLLFSQFIYFTEEIFYYLMIKWFLRHIICSIQHYLQKFVISLILLC